ncbi:hypothetical protein TNCV_1389041 [Trichonephila clavipes]|nr:hypothetical protein TNCV_1389041 [Trichonephila clavipes]
MPLSKTGMSNMNVSQPDTSCEHRNHLNDTSNDRFHTVQVDGATTVQKIPSSAKVTNLKVVRSNHVRVTNEEVRLSSRTEPATFGSISM